MPHAKLGNQRIDRAESNTCPPTCVSKFSGRDVIFAIGLKQGKRSESLDDLCRGLRPGKALQKFLKDEARRHDDVRSEESILQRIDLRYGHRCVAADGQ